MDTNSEKSVSTCTSPPTAALPPIARFNSFPLAELLSNVDYLRSLYNPEVRGSRRRKVQKGSVSTDNASTDKNITNAIRSDEFERTYAIRWLTALIARGDILPITCNEDEESRDRLIESAASLLAACAGTAASGRLARTFIFESAQGGDPITVQLADAPLENSDYGTLGAQTWGAACVLAEMIVETPAIFGFPAGGEYPSIESTMEPLQVLELGAGTGLAGLTTAKLLESLKMPGKVRLSDFHPTILENLRTNADQNFPCKSSLEWNPSVDVDVVKLDWEIFAKEKHHDDRSSGELGKFNLILGADIVYEALHAEWLRACVTKLLASNLRARFHLLVPLRRTHTVESGTIKKVFDRETSPIHDSGTQGDKNTTMLGIISEERFFCDADGSGLDEVEYAYYQIGWMK